ncbi:MAG: hypothetical protein OZ921_05885 [Sorangiineae bacterium]|nr:hypothetical protein [Polyangiaceae bacterium]MEB2322024.1 hypothetical protein [Sorangiineae bacterium]
MALACLAVLVVGLGPLGVQFIAAAAGDGRVELHADPAGHDPSGSGIFLSARFSTYASLAFGMVGSPLRLLALAPSAVTLLPALRARRRAARPRT